MRRKINDTLDQDDLAIMALRFMGYKQIEIAKFFEVSQSSICRRLDKIRDYTGASRRIEIN